MRNSRFVNTLNGVPTNLTGIRRVDKYIDNAIDSAIKYTADSIKRNLGKEYFFHWNENSMIITEIIDKFIRKYDKHFNMHTVKGPRDSISITNKRFIMRIGKNTFVYIATGNKIGNTEERFLMNSSISSRDMYIYICGKNAKKVERAFEKLTHKIWCNDELGIFTVDASERFAYGGEGNKGVSESLDVTYSKMAVRTLDTLFFSHNEKKLVCDHIDKFNSNKDFYMEKQLLYKTGILLSGEPGTGKSSFVKALASTYNRSIVNINVSNIKYIDLNKLTQAINVDEQRQYIILLEDIDTLFLNRKDENTDKEDQAVVNKLLQFLDSNTSPTNVIFIATTNHIERLDEALLREGRFDLKVEVKPIDTKEVHRFGSSFGLTEYVVNDIIKQINTEFPDRKLINQSLLQARILGRIENRSNEKAAEIYGVMKE